MGSQEVGGPVDNLFVDLPPGFVGDPRAVPKCTAAQFSAVPAECPPESQVGVAEIATRPASTFGMDDFFYPIYNLQPRKGKVAEFGIPDIAGFTSVRVVAKARTNGDFGVTTFVPQIPAALELYGQTITLWGVPWAREHDAWRTAQFDHPDRGIPHSGLAPADRVSYDPNWGPIKPFISNPSECDSLNPPLTKLAIDSYLAPGTFTSEGDPLLSDLDWKTVTAPAPPVSGCGAVPFAPSIGIQPTSSAADSSTGLNVDLNIPQNDDPPQSVRNNPDGDTGAPGYWRSAAGRATAQLDTSVVTLPQGVSVNPSGAAGLAGCSDAQVGLVQDGTPPLFNNEDPFDDKGQECPDGSVLGTVQVETPVLEEPIVGRVVLGMPRSTDPGSGEMFRLFIVAEVEDRGLIAKIFGSAVADPATGQLTARFEKNPRVPFENLRLAFKGGPRGQLAMPQRCGAPGWSSTFTPWTAAHGGGGVDVSDGGTFNVAGNCAFGFSPTLNTGMSDPKGGGSGVFTFTLSRQDGEQWFRGVSAVLPTGLLAAVKDVPLCTSAQARTGSCPAASRIGTVDGGAGSGSPFFLEKKGDAYLTEGYKGAPYGLVVKVPVEAGPFRGQFALTPIIVRQALYVDPDNAHVTAVSDPLPEIWHGIPLRVRQLTVNVDRPGFMRNPTSCAAKQIRTTVTSAPGAVATPAQAFRAAGCGSLPFKPGMTMRLSGKRQTRTNGNPALTATVRATPGQANIKDAEVRLPLSIALDPRNSTDPKMLCSYEGGLAGNCPAPTVIGQAKAVSPLLKRPLTGPVHLVQGIRFGPKGNRIRTLPTLLVKLRGEVTLNLRGTTNTSKQGKLISRFANVPDAQVSRFDIKINGGKKGILTVTRSRDGDRISICSRRQVTEVDFDAQNGRRRDFNVKVSTPCKGNAAARRAARRR